MGVVGAREVGGEENALPLTMSGSPFKFIIRGIEGPKRSASRRPTFLPRTESATARLTAKLKEKDDQFVNIPSGIAKFDPKDSKCYVRRTKK